MNKTLMTLAALALATPALAQEEEAAPSAPGPSDIINAASPEEWVVIEAEDLLVMTLAPDGAGKQRKVIIQLMPEPFSQGWTGNIRKLARAKWYDNTSVNRVQDNYVVQWGDPNYDNPESAGDAKALPEDLANMREGEYVTIQNGWSGLKELGQLVSRGMILNSAQPDENALTPGVEDKQWDLYAQYAGFAAGWPVGFGSAFSSTPGELVVPRGVAKEFFASSQRSENEPVFGNLTEDSAKEAKRLASTSLTAVWPVHCYGMVGVGRNYSPDTGSGAELYTVIGHAPRHLDRNIAVVGRIIAGMEHLSSLPRGTGALGFYSKDEASLRTPILSIRVASDLPENERPLFEYLSTDSRSFARYADTRANRRDPFFITPAGGADVCNVTVPVRPFEYTDD